MARPREYDEALADRLVDAAARVLAEEGPQAVSLRRVATEASTSTTAIYSLIGGKEELVRAMYRAGFERMAARFAAVPVTDDPVEDLFQQGLAYHDNAVANPHLYDVMFGCPFPEFQPSDDDAAVSLATFQALIDATQRCIDAGAFVGDTMDLALEVWGANHGITSLALNGTIAPADKARRQLAHVMRAQCAGYLAEARDAAR